MRNSGETTGKDSKDAAKASQFAKPKDEKKSEKSK